MLEFSTQVALSEASASWRSCFGVRHASSQCTQTAMEAACTSVPSDPAAAVLIDCEPMPEGTPVIRGYDFANGDSDGGHLRGVMDAMLCTGFQVTTKRKWNWTGLTAVCRLATTVHRGAQPTQISRPPAGARVALVRESERDAETPTALTVLCRATGDELRQSLP